MTKKVSKEVVGLAVLLILFVVAGLFASTPDQDSPRTVGEELSADPSIYNNRPHGSRALFEWTKALGYNPVVERNDWTHLPNNSTLLISVAPESVQGFDITGAAAGDDGDGKLSVDDALGIKSWLKDGRTLLLLTSRLPSAGTVTDVGPSGDDDSDDNHQPTFGDTVGISVESATHTRITSFVPLQPNQLVVGVDSIKLSSGNSRVERSRRDYMSLFASINSIANNRAIVEPSVVVVREGAGRIIVVADDYFASNENLSQADNAEFISNVLSTSARRGSNVLFDEYHHNAVHSTDDLWTALGRPLQDATWQLVLVCLLIVAMAAPRFGAVKTLKQGEARASGEYLSSLASLYRRADATVPALETLYRQFLRDLCEKLALPPDVPLEKLAEVAARTSGINANVLKRLISACETALDNQNLTGSDLLTLTRQMEQVKRQLNK